MLELLEAREQHEDAQRREGEEHALELEQHEAQHREGEAEHVEEVPRLREARPPAIKSNQKQSEAIRGTPKHSEALRSTPKQSEAIRSNPEQTGVSLPALRRWRGDGRATAARCPPARAPLRTQRRRKCSASYRVRPGWPTCNPRQSEAIRCNQMQFR